MNRTTLSYCTLALAAVIAFALVSVTVAPVITSAGGNKGASGDLGSGEFSTHIDNPLFPLSTLDTKIFEGEQTDPDTGEIITTRLESTVLDRTRKVAGIRVLVLEEKAYQDDQLIERALDYFAQRSDGAVFYFGEDVDNYVDGNIDNHHGTWRAGKDGAAEGIVMPAVPFAGQVFKQENAPGVAEDQAEVLALNESVSTPAGDFHGCLKTEDSSLLDPAVIDFKWYCPGIGLVRDEGPDGFIELTRYTADGDGENATSEQIDAGGDPISQPAVATDVEEDVTDDAGEDDGDDAGNGGHNTAAVLTGVSTPSAAQPAAAPANVGSTTAASGQIDDGAELLPQASITLAQAIAAAQSAASGPVGEIDLEHFEGKLVFNVDIGDKDVKVDAQTGAVLSAGSED